jgi:DNA-binding protein HU-beta
MNKSELIEDMSSSSGLSKTETKKALDAMISIALRTLTKGEKIQIQNVGTLSVKVRAARKGRNPQTGKEISIPTKRVVTYKANCPGPH